MFLALYHRPLINTTLRIITPNVVLTEAVVFTFLHFSSFLVTGLVNSYRLIVIALCCIVFVLLIAVGLLTWRLCRALKNKRENTPERSTSYKVEPHDTPRDKHVSLGDEYCEPFGVMPPATSHCQSLHKNGISAKYSNVVSNTETKKVQEEELYITIIP